MLDDNDEFRSLLAALADCEDDSARQHGEARIRHTAVGLNYIDTYHRSGLYPLALPTAIGGEGAGVVEAVGPGVTDIKVGDRVAYGNAPIGSYAEARIIPAGRLVKIPDGISDQQAASMMLKGLTTQYLIRRCYRVQKGDMIARIDVMSCRRGRRSPRRSRAPLPRSTPSSRGSSTNGAAPAATT